MIRTITKGPFAPGTIVKWVPELQGFNPEGHEPLFVKVTGKGTRPTEFSGNAVDKNGVVTWRGYHREWHRKYFEPFTK